METGTPSRPKLAAWPLAVLSALLFALCLAAGTRSNGFPFFYHPDEPGKVDQLLGGPWNFHHPLLLLRTTKLARKLAGIPPTAQDCVVAGRWVSAAFSALAVVALSGFTLRLRGRTAAAATALLLLFNHQIFELSHYLKEDTALLAGLALSLLAAQAFSQRASPAHALGMGIACALAISGKYLGVVALAFAIPALQRCPPSARPRLWLTFLAAFSIALVAINFPLVENLVTFRTSFDREVGLVVHGQHGGGWSPHFEYWKTFVDNVTPALWPFLLLGYWSLWRSRRAHTLPAWSLALFPVACAILLSFSPKSNDRYFLPVTAFFLCLAGIGVSAAVDLLAGKLSRRLAIGLCLLVSVLAETPAFIRYWRAFRHDDRADMRAWMRAHLPPDATVLQESRVLLPAADNQRWPRPDLWPQKIETTKLACDAGSLDELRRKGFTHLAVSESDYGRFFRGSGKTPGQRQAREFYELLHRSPPLWQRARGKVIYLHPGLEIYSLAR